MQQILPASAVYHIALAVRILPPLDTSALRAALQAIVDRHDALRTVFRMDADGELVQEVRACGSVRFETIDTAGGSAGEIDARVTAAFDSRSISRQARCFDRICSRTGPTIIFCS